MRYTARAPLRVDLGGSWSCLPSYAEREGGVALCVAITLYAEGSIALPTGEGPLRRLRSDRRYVSYSLDLPLGAGLGASAAQSVLYVALLRSVIDNAADREEVARASCQIGSLLGTLRGRQDPYASAIGDMTAFEVSSDVLTERLQPASSVRDEFSDRCLLLWSGEAGHSYAVAGELERRVRDGDHAVLEGLAALKRSASEMRDAMKVGDVDAVAALAAEHWHRQNQLLPEAATPAIREVAERATALGAAAVKQCGIAGGTVLVLSRRGDRAHLVEALSARGMWIMQPHVDTYGVHLRKA
jgi:D-glycero-alpha-D-manno-heptose-7-phosphate kinase